MNKPNLFSLALFSLFFLCPVHANSPILITADNTSLSGIEFMNSIEAAYMHGKYTSLLEDLDQEYQKNSEHITAQPTDEEMFFWNDIFLRNNENRRSLLENLEIFSVNNPSSCLGKMLHEFLSFSLSDQEKEDLLFITHSLDALTNKVVNESNNYYKVWFGIKQITHAFKVKHAILNARIIASDDYITDDIKAHHIVLDLSMRDALIAFLAEDLSLTQKVKRSFSAYMKYLGHEYNFHYINSLMDENTEANSKDELTIKGLISKFFEEEKRIKEDQLKFIDKSGDGVFPE